MCRASIQGTHLAVTRHSCSKRIVEKNAQSNAQVPNERNGGVRLANVQVAGATSLACETAI
jgi:hypothetical protein